MEDIKWIYQIELDVRDYECDLQGIVNNSVYQNYMEHTRHQFLLSVGGDFAELHSRGIDFVVSRVEIDFKTSLRSGDRFISRLNLYREGIRIIFNQEIRRCSDDALCAKGRVSTVCVKDGKPTKGYEMDEYLGLL